ncbi:hypothetical protein [Sneathiella sp.]|jgi:hypothetical protein|uniref:hypothetical protein n=1 Tax=Sneathiella sp. TaxID=1964365 RepID=UPI0039E594F6
MLFKKIDLREKIVQGDIYYRAMQINAQEEAKVLYVSDDDFGIPHVHFERTLLGSGYKDPQGVRVLALDTFAKDFRLTN